MVLKRAFFFLIVSLPLLLAFSSCGLVSSIGSDCYVDDFKITQVVDDDGIEFEPQKMTLVSFGVFEEDYCGIPSEAKPIRRIFIEKHPIFDQDVERMYPAFAIPNDGVEDTRKSLAGNVRDFPAFVILGTELGGKGEFSDDLSMWPLYNSEWR